MMRRPIRSPFWRAVRIMIAPMIVVSVFMLVWLKSEITSIEYRISEYETEKMDLLKRKKELIVHRSDELSVKNIEHVAMEKLGLTFPDRKKIIYVKRGENPYNFRAALAPPSE